MRNLFRTTQFKKDMKRVKKRGKRPEKLKIIVDQLINHEPLDDRFKAHRLVGNWYPNWECHIEPDWLLVWEESDSEIILVRTGTHSDLFG